MQKDSFRAPNPQFLIVFVAQQLITNYISVQQF